jgi:two-component system, OmpR family, sensor kinase
VRRPGAAVRLGLQTGLLVVGVLAVVGVLLFVIYERSVDESVGDTLTASTSLDAPVEAPPGVHVLVVGPGGGRTSAGMPPGFPDESQLRAVSRDGRSRQSDRVVDGRHYTVRTSKVDGRVVQAVLDRHELDEGRSRTLSALLVAGGVGVVLSGLVATFLARRAMRPLTESLAMQRRFVADASHELRTPLTLLSTRVQLVARRARASGRPVGPQDLDGVLADTGRLTGVLDDLLVAADSRGAAHGRVDLVDLVRSSVESAAGLADERGLAVDLDVAAPAYVDGVEVALHRAVTALLDNALDHAASRVRVRVVVERRRVAVLVVDDGPGIPDTVDARRLFDRFTSVREDGPPGGRRHYGIGLALVADVAAAHGGSVTAAERDDGATGAVFALSLPRAR